MKRENKLLFAGSIGFFALLGIIGLFRFLNKKQCLQDDYSDYYTDFNQQEDQEENHGIEFLAMK